MDDSDMGGDANDPSGPDIEATQTTSASEEPMEGEGQPRPPAREQNRKFVATIHEVNEAFDSVNTLRYSQPTHLQGASPSSPDMAHNSVMTQESARVSLSPRSALVTPSVAPSGKSALHPLGRLSML